MQQHFQQLDYVFVCIVMEAGFWFQTEFKTEVNLSIGLKPYFIV